MDLNDESFHHRKSQSKNTIKLRSQTDRDYKYREYYTAPAWAFYSTNLTTFSNVKKTVTKPEIIGVDCTLYAFVKYLNVIFGAADLVLLLSALTDYLRNVVIQLSVVGAGVIKII